MKFLSIKELKINAKELYISNMAAPVFITIAYGIINLMLMMCPQITYISNHIAVVIFSEVITFIFSVFLGLFSYGLCYYFLNYSTGKEYGFGDLFYAFYSGPDRILKVSLLINVISVICSLPGNIYRYLLPQEPTQLQILISFGLLFAGTLLNILVTLWLEPIYFIMADLPNLSAGQAIKMCSWIMKGQIFKLLGLKLSFIPMYLLGLMSFGIAMLWINPYQRIATTLFYLDLAEKKAKKNA